MSSYGDIIKESRQPFRPRLNFWEARLSFPHAAIRISLREVPEGQRNSRPLNQMGGHALSTLRFNKADQKAFSIRVRRRSGVRTHLHWHAQFVRHVRDRQTAFALEAPPQAETPPWAETPNTKHQTPEKHQGTNINWSLRFGVSLELGVWCLDFAVSSAPFTLRKFSCAPHTARVGNEPCLSPLLDRLLPP